MGGPVTDLELFKNRVLELVPEAQREEALNRVNELLYMSHMPSGRGEIIVPVGNSIEHPQGKVVYYDPRIKAALPEPGPTRTIREKEKPLERYFLNGLAYGVLVAIFIWFLFH
jgi:hypothetical protein